MTAGDTGPGLADAAVEPDDDHVSRTRMAVAAIGFLILAIVGYGATWTAMSELQIAVVRITTALSVIGLAASALAFAPLAITNGAAAKAAFLGGALATGAASYTTYPIAPFATGTSKTRLSYYIEGVITSRTGCTGAFFSSAPQPGSTGNLLLQIWLADGVLGSAAGIDRAATFQGRLRTDGSFHLIAVEPSANGERGRIDGRIAADGSMTATWDSVFLSGCVNHFKSTRGRLMTGATLADLLRTEK
jgi:hypothetical protein